MAAIYVKNGTPIEANSKCESCVHAHIMRGYRESKAKHHAGRISLDGLLDEIPDLGVLTLTTRLNGQVMQQAPISDLIFSVPVIVSYISKFTPLYPGDVIATGTPGGVGDRREPPVYMKDGDIVEIEIDRVGILWNVVQTDPQAVS